MTSIAVVTNMLTPYRIPLFNAIQTVEDIELHVIALVDMEKNRQWTVSWSDIQFPFTILDGYQLHLAKSERSLHLSRGLWRELYRLSPDVIVLAGYDAPACWSGLVYSKIARRNAVLWSGTTELSSQISQGIGLLAKKCFVKSVDGYLSYGTKAAEYLAGLGAPLERITVGLNTVDMRYFRSQMQLLRAGRDGESQNPVLRLLYVGRLTERKGVALLLQAITLLRDVPIHLSIVGDGPLRSELENTCEREGLANISFVGYQQQEALPQYYATSDVLVFPTLWEVWGLVVNEALASGLYVLCSDQAGAAYDLINKSWNGELFEPGNPHFLANLIRRTWSDLTGIRARRDAISRAACEKYDIKTSAEFFVEAVRMTGSNTPNE